MQKTYNCVAKTMFGLENVLADELEEYGAENVQILNRAVSFDANKATLYRVNLRSRTAISVLVEQVSFWMKHEDDLYKKIKQINWGNLLSVEKTFMIRATVNSRMFSHSQFVAYRAKDAIADWFMEDRDRRPNVDTKNPDLKIQVHISDRKCTISLDSSGDPLFKRGYRQSRVLAPINESLAAGILLLAGWTGNRPLLDPMCGSGTFLIEAGMIAHNIPPGMKRRFGFQSWINYDPDLWDMVFKEEVAKITDSPVKIFGYDRDQEALASARDNVTTAFLEDSIVLKKQDFFESEWEREEKPLIVMNPPYDERLQEEDVIHFYKQIGNQLKFQYTGAEAWIISSNLHALKHVGLRPTKKVKMYNGPLECKLNYYQMYRGSKKEMKKM